MWTMIRTNIKYLNIVEKQNQESLKNMFVEQGIWRVEPGIGCDLAHAQT